MDLNLLTMTTIVNFIAILYVQGIDGYGMDTPHKRLLQQLLDTYGSPSLRPVHNLNTSVHVELRLLISQVIQFDERAQQLKISAWMKQTWTDEFLRWNQSDYEGVDSLTISLSKIWLPDITLYENVNDDFEHYKPIDPIVLPDGTVTWYTPVILTTSCNVKVRYFPFDSQRCHLRFASWSYDKSKVDILYSTDADAMQMVFHSNGVWDLVDVKAVRTEVQYACCQYPIAFVTFNLSLKRMSGFYVFNIVIPCIMLALLTLMVFCLPHDSGEKISLGTTNLLALILYQQLIADSMPPLGDEFPLVGMYFFSLVVIGCCSISGTVGVLHLWHRKTTNNPFPSYLRRLLALSVTKYLVNFKDEISRDGDNHRSNTQDAQGTFDLKPDSNCNNIYVISGNHSTAQNDTKHTTTSATISCQTHSEPIANGGKILADEHNEKSTCRLSEWQKIAVLTDRLLFVTLSLIIVLTLACMLFLFLVQKE